MSNQTDNGTEKKNFIRETVEPPRVNRKRRLLRRLGILVGTAVLFGGVAGFSFVLTKPWMEARFGAQATVAESIVIPRDEESSTEEESTKAEVIDPEEMEQEIESKVEARVDAYLATLDAEAKQENVDPYRRLDSVQTILEPSLVEVTSRSAGEDVFKNSFTRSEQTFGVITAKTENSLLILTENTLIQDAGVYVAFGQETVDATVLAVDEGLGMAVVQVDKENLSSESWDRMNPVKLGNSYSLKRGMFVAALGNPMGHTGSALAGSVSFINPLQQGTDLNFQLIQTDMACDREASGILVDESGAMIGWITQNYNSDGMSGLLAAVSISELKGSIERLANGKGNACVGIRYQVIDETTSESLGIPVGLYIDRCVKNGPASEAGIQNGDILTALDDSAITNDRDFRTFLESKDPGDEIVVTVMRQGKGEMVEQTYKLTLAAH